MVSAARRLLDLLDDEGRQTVLLPLDATQWRMWNNTEIYLFVYGLRMDEISPAVRDAICGIGETDGEHPFYYRIQSPVIMIEFDEHAGVFLSNEEPERFHIHTIVRTPNGNDYGMDLLRMHYAQAHPGRRPGA
jgi:hypothetical protein